MNSSLFQLLVLAGVAIFLILRLRSVLGTREGFEKPPLPAEQTRRTPALEVIEGGPDPDIVDHVPEHSDAAQAFSSMKRLDDNFRVSDFLQGARGAYEMILMAFERGELEEIRPYISPDIYEVFAEFVEDRKSKGLTVEATFIGVSELAVHDATFDSSTNEAEISLRITGEYSYTVYDKGGDIVEGGGTTSKRQRDVWTFARTMGTDDPNWMLVATDA